MKKIRLLFVINQFFKGGAETAIFNLLHSLSRERYEIDFLIFDDIKLPGTISLIPDLPDWIRVINTAEQDGFTPAWRRYHSRLCQKLTGSCMFPQTAVKYVRSHEYDAAISCGEWFSSSLVGKESRADKKYVWIHADMDKAGFLHPDILHYQHLFDGFLFVSEPSRQAALTRFPELTQRAFLVHNMVNRCSILRKSQEPLPAPLPNDGLPCLVTVANIRPEKNHLRQVRVMAKLQNRGVRFHWLNIGSPSSPDTAAALEKAISENALENCFHFLGAMENPYPIMAAAQGVCVLSDHESWSMVITEAKTLGVPVIATKTSGALAQLTDGETGILCDFDDESIANQIEALLTQPATGERIRKNLSGFSCSEETLRQLEPLLLEKPKKILYVFDDINYVSGARNAALQQVKFLQNRCDVRVLSSEPCEDRQLKALYTVVDYPFNCLYRPTREVLRDARISRGMKLIRIAVAVAARFGISFTKYFNRELTDYMESFDAVCVISEGSRFRELVSQLRKPQKIQWIHTDYTAWKDLTSWTREITRRDGEIYSHYDNIVCLSPRLRDKFAAMYPALKEKVLAIPNPINRERILSLAENSCDVPVNSSRFNLITVGRMEAEKRHNRLLEIAAVLNGQLDFHWYFVGDGCLLASTKLLCHSMGLDNRITFTGNMANPYPLMKQCDVFVLLSEYEGTPITIDESKVLGLPVLANNVGGVADMLTDGTWGHLLPAMPSVEEAAHRLLEMSKEKKAIVPTHKHSSTELLEELFGI